MLPKFVPSTSGGLSPRVRGNLELQPDGNVAERSIPACAGEPGCQDVSGHTARVYPRVCGGTYRALLRGRGVFGLSPRVRGNQGQRMRPRKSGRSIPACAGEPALPAPPGECPPVYPRVCGGTGHQAGIEQSFLGLSPRVRGNLRVASPDCAEPGSIPACAGGTTGNAVLLRAVKGLSPRVRGNRERQRCSQTFGGSIPACAGEPLRIRASGSIYSVYPRVCGGTLR